MLNPDSAKCVFFILMFLKAFKLFLSAICFGLICLPCNLSANVNAKTLALIININDKASVETGSYYKKLRNIPEENIIKIGFEPNKKALTVEEFQRIYARVKQLTPDSVQAYALAWSQPYKAGCMSITSAFALGFDEGYCAEGCKVTRRIPYANSNSNAPFTDFGIRPTMMLAAKDLRSVFELINRGVSADYSRPHAEAYLLNTSDKERSVRSIINPIIKKTLDQVANINVLDENYIRDVSGIMFYFTGTTRVRYLDTLGFAPGAIADHLTSAGGVLFDSFQMSILDWIEAGATTSYGTVVEPCNYLEKFPNPGVAIQHYLNGDTLIEAYWKSVAMPGQGVFVGEPLAAPYRGCKIVLNKQGEFVFLKTQPENYVLRFSTACH